MITNRIAALALQVVGLGLERSHDRHPLPRLHQYLMQSK